MHEVGAGDAPRVHAGAELEWVVLPVAVGDAAGVSAVDIAPPGRWRSRSARRRRSPGCRPSPTPGRPRASASGRKMSFCIWSRLVSKNRNSSSVNCPRWASPAAARGAARPPASRAPRRAGQTPRRTAGGASAGRTSRRRASGRSSRPCRPTGSPVGEEELTVVGVRRDQFLQVRVGALARAQPSR